MKIVCHVGGATCVWPPSLWMFQTSTSCTHSPSRSITTVLWFSLYVLQLELKDVFPGQATSFQILIRQGPAPQCCGSNLVLQVLHLQPKDLIPVLTFLYLDSTILKFNAFRPFVVGVTVDYCNKENLGVQIPKSWAKAETTSAKTLHVFWTNQVDSFILWLSVAKVSWFIFTWEMTAWYPE